MAIDEHLILFNRLYQRTRDGSLKWTETVDENTFSVAFKDFSVSIHSVRGDHGATDYVFQILNDSGEVVDQFRDTELGSMFEYDEERREFYESVARLFEIARRNARGADQALKSILRQLGDDGIPF